MQTPLALEGQWCFVVDLYCNPTITTTFFFVKYLISVSCFGHLILPMNILHSFLDVIQYHLVDINPLLFYVLTHQKDSPLVHTPTRLSHGSSPRLNL